MKVLIAVDGSDIAEGAFNWYLDNMHKEGDEIIIGHVTEQHSHSFGSRAGMGVSKEQWEEMMKEDEGKVQAVNDKFTARLKQKNIASKFSHETGEPGHHIIHIAETENAQLIVMGTRGQGSVRRTILGSVSDYVLHHAHVPVAICRASITKSL